MWACNTCLPNQPTKCRKQSPFWEANSCSDSHEIPHILWKLKAHYHVQHSPLSAPIWARLIQSMPYHPISWRSILIISSHIPNVLLPSDFPMKNLYTFIFTTTCAIGPTHLILLDLITQIAFGEEKNSWSSSLCNSLQPPVISSLLGQNNKVRVRCASWSCTNSIRKPKLKVPVGSTGFERILKWWKFIIELIDFGTLTMKIKCAKTLHWAVNNGMSHLLSFCAISVKLMKVI